MDKVAAEPHTGNDFDAGTVEGKREVESARRAVLASTLWAGIPLADAEDIASAATAIAVRRYDPGRGRSLVALARGIATNLRRRHWRDRARHARTPARRATCPPRKRKSGLAVLYQRLVRDVELASLAGETDCARLADRIHEAVPGSEPGAIQSAAEAVLVPGCAALDGGAVPNRYLPVMLRDDSLGRVRTKEALRIELADARVSARVDGAKPWQGVISATEQLQVMGREALAHAVVRAAFRAAGVDHEKVRRLDNAEERRMSIIRKRAGLRARGLSDADVDRRCPLARNRQPGNV